MFLEQQGINNIKVYKETLLAIGALSKLSSENTVPYLGYREAENIFCMAFEATNLSRGDTSADASKDGVGIGIKTFISKSGNSMQKIAEFNKGRNSYIGKTSKEIIEIVSYLRNQRIGVTKRIHNLDTLIYHCVVREEGKFKIFECNMDEVNIDKIKNIKESEKNTITFNDDKNEYSFNLSKSTLYKRFNTENVLLEVNIKIIENVYEALKDFVLDKISNRLKFTPITNEKQFIFLPLFSDGKHTIPERAQLNQWNANGRKRNSNEVYISIPPWIHRKFPGFLPPRKQSFDLLLPNGNTMSCSVCQGGDKGLMSNPNKALGQWLLRDVLNLKEKELLTYSKLEELGLDSVVIYKELDGKYSMNFTEIGSYDEFKKENK